MVGDGLLSVDHWVVLIKVHAEVDLDWDLVPCLAMNHQGETGRHQYRGSPTGQCRDSTHQFGDLVHWDQDDRMGCICFQAICLPQPSPKPEDVVLSFHHIQAICSRSHYWTSIKSLFDFCTAILLPRRCHIRSAHFWRVSPSPSQH